MPDGAGPALPSLPASVWIVVSGMALLAVLGLRRLLGAGAVVASKTNA